MGRAGPLAIRELFKKKCALKKKGVNFSFSVKKLAFSMKRLSYRIKSLSFFGPGPARPGPTPKAIPNKSQTQIDVYGSMRTYMGHIGPNLGSYGPNPQ